MLSCSSRRPERFEPVVVQTYSTVSFMSKYEVVFLEPKMWEFSYSEAHFSRLEPISGETGSCTDVPDGLKKKHLIQLKLEGVRCMR